MRKVLYFQICFTCTTGSECCCVNSHNDQENLSNWPNIKGLAREDGITHQSHLPTCLWFTLMGHLHQDLTLSMATQSFVYCRKKVLFCSTFIQITLQPVRNSKYLHCTAGVDYWSQMDLSQEGPRLSFSICLHLEKASSDGKQFLHLWGLVLVLLGIEDDTEEAKHTKRGQEETMQYLQWVWFNVVFQTIIQNLVSPEPSFQVSPWSLGLNFSSKYPLIRHHWVRQCETLGVWFFVGSPEPKFKFILWDPDQDRPFLQADCFFKALFYTGGGAPCNTPTQIMEHIAVNGSVQTGCKQYQRVCSQIYVPWHAM